MKLFRSLLVALHVALYMYVCQCQSDDGIFEDVFTIPFNIPVTELIDRQQRDLEKSNRSISLQSESCEEISSVCQFSDPTDLIPCALQILLERHNSGTTGYVSVTNADTDTGEEDDGDLKLWLIFLKSSLRHQTISGFVRNLNSSLHSIASSLSQCLPDHGYQLEEKKYNDSIDTSIDSTTSTLGDDIYFCGPSTCVLAGYTQNLTKNCYYNITGAYFNCVDKCQQFVAETSCTAVPPLYGIYVSGACKYDFFKNPYCDCGSSPGNILNNFYDGERCVSVTFIVAMSASAGGFVLILLVVSLCVIHRQRKYLVVIMERLVELQKKVAAYANKEKYEKLNRIREEEGDSTPEAICITEKTTRKNSYELSGTKSKKKGDDFYDGVDLYPYLRKDPLTSPKLAAKELNNSNDNEVNINNNNSNNNNESSINGSDHRDNIETNESLTAL